MDLIHHRKENYHWLKKQKRNIMCLQEVHIREQDLKYLKHKELGEEFISLTSGGKSNCLYIIKDIEPRLYLSLFGYQDNI